MIVIALNREPVVHALTGPFAGASVTLRRLTSNEYEQARAAALSVIRDRSQLVELLERHDLRPAGRKLAEILADVDFMMGVGEWIAAVECGVRAISAWDGFSDETGQAIGPTRAALEAAFLSQPFLDQVRPAMDAAAQLLVIEGKGFGASPPGSPAAGMTASAPTTAPTAGSAERPAPAALSSPPEPAPKRPTRRSRAKAPKSGR